MKKTSKTLIILSIFFVLTFTLFAQSASIQSISIPIIKLNNGVKMPILGFGTLDLKGQIGESCVAKAISLGYRLFDTATIYGNEEAVGRGIQTSGIDRKELFITTKLWIRDMGYENTKIAFEKSLKNLNLSYVDLYLIHRPHGDVKGSWKAMEELYKAGKIKAIGVSNFDSSQLANLMSYAEIQPAINQIEVNPFFQQDELQKETEKHGVKVEAWSPFAQGRKDLFSNSVLVEIGKKHNKTAAQVTLRWLLQRGIIVIPRTSNVDYMKENLDIFDFELSKSDMKRITSLDQKVSQFPEWN